MKTKVTRDAIVCDGCEYLIGTAKNTIVLNVRGELFHFHDGTPPTDRRDCFRYWAHGPRIMERSLREREWDDEKVDEFLSQMLYRKDNSSFSPGVPRPEKKVA